MKGDLDKATSILKAGLADGSQDHVPVYYPLLLARDQKGLMEFLREQQLRSIKVCSSSKSISSRRHFQSNSRRGPDPLSHAQRLREIGHQIVRMFDADR